MNDVAIAYSIHQVFGFVCSLATLTVLCRQWYALYKEKINGPSRSRYAVVRVQVASVGGGGGGGGTVGGGNGGNTTGGGDDDAPIASTNGQTRGGGVVDHREPDSRPASNDGNTQVLIRRWCAVAAVIQIFAFVDPYGVRGIYPLCMWRFTHNLITSDLHCLGLGVYFITSQVIYRLLNSKPHAVVVITLVTLASVTVIMGALSPILQCYINESWTHSLNLYWLAIVDLFWGIALTSNLRRLQHTLDVHARSSNKREALQKFQRFVFYSRIILACLFVSFCFQIYTAIGVTNRNPIKGADPWHYSWMQQVFVYIQTLAILFSVSYLRRPTIRRRRAEGSRTGGTNGGVPLTGDGSPANGPTITISGSPIVNARRATAQSQLFVPSPRASGQGQFHFGSTIRSARASGVNMFVTQSPKNSNGGNGTSGGSPQNGARTLGGTLAIATSSKLQETEKSILTPRSPGAGGGSPTGVTAISPLGPVAASMVTSGSTLATMSGNSNNGVGSGFGNGARGSLSVGRHMGGLLAVLENNAAASAAAANGSNGGTLSITNDRSPPHGTQSLYLSSTGSPSRTGTLAATISGNNGATSQFLSPDRSRLALFRMTSEHDLSPQHSPLSINSLAPLGGASPLAAATPLAGNNGSHFTYGITGLPSSSSHSNNSPPTMPSLASHGPISPLPLGAPRSPLKLSHNPSSNGGANGAKTPTPPTSGRVAIAPLPVGVIIASHGPSSAASPGRTPHSAHSSRSTGSGRLLATQHVYGGEDTVGPLISLGSRRTALPTPLDSTSLLLHAPMPNTIEETDTPDTNDDNDTAPLSPGAVR